MKKLKVTKYELSVFMCCFGLFITGSILRSGIYDFKLLQRYAPLFYLGIIGIVLKSRMGTGNLSRRKYDKFLLYSSLFLIIYSAISLVLYGDFIHKFSLYISIILPTIVLGFRYRDSSELKILFRCWMKWLRISCGIIVLVGIVDVLSRYSFTKFMADFTNTASFYRMLRQQRIVSYMGHSLYTSELLLSLYLFSHLFKKYEGKKDSTADFLISLTGLLMTKSRAALILLIAAYLLFNLEWKKLRYVLMGLASLLMLYQLHALDSVLERFGTGGFSSDIRNTSLSALLNSGVLRFEWFLGQDYSVLSEAGELTASLEYPILRWAYGFGIIISALLVLVNFVIPIIRCILFKQKDVLIALIIIIVDVNTYSGLANVGMQMTHYCVMCCLLINLAIYFSRIRLNEDPNPPGRIELSSGVNYEQRKTPVIQ